MTGKAPLWRATASYWSELAAGAPIDGKWIRSRLLEIARLVEARNKAGARSSVNRALLQTTEQGRAFVLGPLTPEAFPLFSELRCMSLCVAGSFPISPVIRHRRSGLGVAPLAAPDGGPFALQYLNLGGEWIRHALYAWHDPEAYRRHTGSLYFPYNYKDHLTHPVLAWLLGHLLLQNQRVDTDVLAALMRANSPATDASAALVAEPMGELWVDVVAWVWATCFPCRELTRLFEADNVYGARDYVLRAWQDCALWHDAGYEPLAWALLSAGEFSHCHFYEPQYVRDCFKEVVRSLAERLAPGGLAGQDPVVRRLTAWAGDFEQIDPFHAVGHIDEWQNADTGTRSWGRSHALLSAFEFLQTHGGSERPGPYDCVVPALAIASHHEARPPDLGTDSLCLELLRNPLGAVLRWADVLAAQCRVTASWDTAEPSRPKLMATYSCGETLAFRQNSALVDAVICTVPAGTPAAGSGCRVARFLWGDVYKQEPVGDVRIGA